MKLKNAILLVAWLCLALAAPCRADDPKPAGTHVLKTRQSKRRLPKKKGMMVRCRNKPYPYAGPGETLVCTRMHCGPCPWWTCNSCVVVKKKKPSGAGMRF
jgi:hypothetical protein